MFMLVCVDIVCCQSVCVCVSVCAVTWVSLSCVNYFALLSHSLLLFSCPPPTPCVLLFTLASFLLFFYSPVILSALYFVVRLQLALNGLCSIYLIKTQFIAALTIFPLRTLAVTVICCCYFCYCCCCCCWCCCVVLFVSSFLLHFCLFPHWLWCCSCCLFCLLCLSLSFSLSLSMCVRVFTVRFSYWLFVLSLRDINTKNHQQHQQQQQKEKQKQKKKQQQQRTKYPLDLARI